MFLHDLLYFCINCIWISVNLTCLPLCLSFTSLGRSLRHSQERHRHCCHVRHEAGAHHEVHHPCGHGGYHSHLRVGGCGADCQQHCRETRPPQVSPACVFSCSGVVLLTFNSCTPHQLPDLCPSILPLRPTACPHQWSYTNVSETDSAFLFCLNSLHTLKETLSIYTNHGCVERSDHVVSWRQPLSV